MATELIFFQSRKFKAPVVYMALNKYIMMFKIIFNTLGNGVRDRWSRPPLPSRFDCDVPAANALSVCCDSKHTTPPDSTWRRSRGRPRHSWQRQICKDTDMSATDVLILAQDRDSWRAVATASGLGVQWWWWWWLIIGNSSLKVVVFEKTPTGMFLALELYEFWWHCTIDCVIRMMMCIVWICMCG